jgi:hypothetical protein
MSKQLMSS